MSNINPTLTPYQQTLLARAGLTHLTSKDVGQKPIEYVVGWVEFCGLKFQVSPDVLIPRIETEQLISLAYQTIKTKIADMASSQKITVADLGTGSGAIGISLLHQLNVFHEKIHLIMSDISPEALQIAQINAQQLLPESNMQILQSDLLNNYPTTQKIDVLIANLPYIPSTRINQLDSSVKDFEPQLALDGGQAGLELIGRLLKQAPQYLAEDGVIWLEIDEGHTLNQLQQITSSFEIEIYKDEFEKTRFVKLFLKSNI